MSLKLSVSSAGNPDERPSEHLFREERITIGRSQGDHLTLPSPEKTVSDEHAILEQTEEACRLIHCSADNDTRLNDRPIAESTPHELHEGDVFRIGGFRIEVHFPEEGHDSDSISEDGDNPFAEPVNQLLDALAALTETYEQEASSPQREETLVDAFSTAHSPVSSHEVVQRSLGLLDRNPVASEATASGKEKTREAELDDTATQDSARSHSANSSILEALASALATILEIPDEFQSEFLGHLLGHPPETVFLYEGDGTTLKQHLVDPSLSVRERQRRLQHVEEAAESMALHQIAMIEGYKASVINGTEEILARLHPDSHQEEVIEENDVFGYEVLAPVSALTGPAVFQRMRTEWTELFEEDWSVVEQRNFRPAFAKAYLSKMSDPHSSNGDMEG